jgi:hypothetical protein
MKIEIESIRDDNLQRVVWSFNVWCDYGKGVGIVLRELRYEERPTKRHKWRVTSKWDANDERSYCSTIERPVEIPTWVKDKAIASIKPRIYIGWHNDASEVK